MLTALRTSVTGLDLGTWTKEKYYLSTKAKLENGHAQDKGEDKECCDKSGTVF